MNVALTRARHHLIIVGHHHTLKANAIWKRVLRSAKKVPLGFNPDPQQFVTLLSSMSISEAYRDQHEITAEKALSMIQSPGNMDDDNDDTAMLDEHADTVLRSSQIATDNRDNTNTDMGEAEAEFQGDDSGTSNKSFQQPTTCSNDCSDDDSFEVESHISEHNTATDQEIDDNSTNCAAEDIETVRNESIRLSSRKKQKRVLAEEDEDSGHDSFDLDIASQDNSKQGDSHQHGTGSEAEAGDVATNSNGASNGIHSSHDSTSFDHV